VVIYISLHFNCEENITYENLKILPILSNIVFIVNIIMKKNIHLYILVISGY